MASATDAGFVRSRRASLIGAIFLMATSAVGPGFITQTATFTSLMGAAFAFGILASIVIDLVVQLNIWRVVTVTGLRAPEVAHAALPGSGYLLAVLIIVSGLTFNVGNIAGAGLGLNALMGLDTQWGGLISALVAVGIFSSRRAGIAIDRIIIVLGVVMLAMTVFVALASQPPIGEALRQTILPDTINFATITTIVGGTVGGYITYAGAHRILDRGLGGAENVETVSRAALRGILVTGVMRYILFLAILGVVASGVIIDVSGQNANPAAQAFQAAAGELGLRAFGLILWAAGITSVIGASYTCMTFLSAFRPSIGEPARNRATLVFIGASLLVFLSLGTPPAALLIFAGGFNGLVLPIGLTLFLYVAWRRSDLMHGHRYPRWLLVSGTAVCALTWYMGYQSIGPIFAFLSPAT
ncbi:NRAMP family divalent metal transporter [Halomonas smyrnensis]|uniref:NRAMP family divalent metal transporter n=1 Tax=Halomonas smyrnensis TaxID=720605 RepID=UPI00036EE3F8|nr:NRAMP family divalent metal transporter [Halomonas smyrnensis]